MRRVDTTHPADIANAHAEADGWPLRYSHSLDFHRPELNTLLAAWRAKAGDRPAPSRNDMDARTLKQVLRRMTIVERVVCGGHTRLRHRFVGSQLVHHFGDYTGGYLDEAVPSHLYPRWETPYCAVLDTCTPLRIRAPYDHPRVNYLSGESLLAPLLDPDGEPNLLLTATYFHRRHDGVDAPVPDETWWQ